MLSKVWRLRIASFLSWPNWSVELVQAYQTNDHISFVYCIEKDPELLRQPLFTEARPFIMAVSFGDIKTLERLVVLGADVNQTDVHFPFNKFDGLSYFEIERKLRIPLFPGFESWPYSVLEIAWFLGFEHIFHHFYRLVSNEIRYQAALRALLSGDQAWIKLFKFNEVFRDLAPSLSVDFSPLTACLFGNCPLDVFAEIWALTPVEVRSSRQIVSTSPPGHEEGNHPILEGDICYWAEHLGRKDILEFIQSQIPSIVK